MPTRVIMLVDVDYFFAQCEEIRNQSLKGKPVVICVYSGRTQDSGVVSTANYIARTYGVKSGMPIFLAKKKLENINAVFLSVDHLFYEEVSRRVMNLLRSFADEFEQVSIDEAYLDVSQRTHGAFEEAQKLATVVKNELRNQEKLSCSIGLGPNKLVAKIAADEKKPDGLTIVSPNQVLDFLAPLPVDRIIGVGKKSSHRLSALGISKIGELARYDLQRLTALFGRTTATYFHDASLGVDDEPVLERQKAESISRIATLKQNTHDLNAILEKIDELCNDIYSRIVNERLSFRTVSIIVITADINVHTRSRTLETPSNDLELMKKTVRELTENFQKETELETRRIGIKISKLLRTERHQKQITSFLEPQTTQQTDHPPPEPSRDFAQLR